MTGSASAISIYLASREVEDRRESDIGQNHKKSGFDDRRGGGAAHGVRSATHSKALKTTDLHNDRCERYALYQASDDIAQDHRVHDVAKVNAQAPFRSRFA